MDVGFADHSIVLTHRGDQQNPFSLVEMRILLGIAREVLEYHSASRTYSFTKMLSLIYYIYIVGFKILCDIRGTVCEIRSPKKGNHSAGIISERDTVKYNIRLSKKLQHICWSRISSTESNLGNMQNPKLYVQIMQEFCNQARVLLN